MLVTVTRPPVAGLDHWRTFNTPTYWNGKRYTPGNAKRTAAAPMNPTGKRALLAGIARLSDLKGVKVARCGPCGRLFNPLIKGHMCPHCGAPR